MQPPPSADRSPDHGRRPCPNGTDGGTVRAGSEGWTGPAKLAAAATLLLALWLGAWPAAGRLSAVRGYIAGNEARGIDPSAKFYSDHPGMPGLYDRVEGSTRRHPAAFWGFSGAKE